MAQVSWRRRQLEKRWEKSTTRKAKERRKQCKQIKMYAIRKLSLEESRKTKQSKKVTPVSSSKSENDWKASGHSPDNVLLDQEDDFEYWLMNAKPWTFITVRWQKYFYFLRS